MLHEWWRGGCADGATWRTQLLKRATDAPRNGNNHGGACCAIGEPSVKSDGLTTRAD
jgi:hypothetical protein